MPNCTPHDYCDYWVDMYNQIYKEDPELEKYDEELKRKEDTE